MLTARPEADRRTFHVTVNGDARNMDVLRHLFASSNVSPVHWMSVNRQAWLFSCAPATIWVHMKSEIESAKGEWAPYLRLATSDSAETVALKIVKGQFSDRFDR